MSIELAGKKLLIMGGVSAICEIVNEAKNLGIKTYVTDYLVDSPAKKIADGSFMVSATDVDAVVELCRREHMDGVFTGYLDLLLPYCQKVCEKLEMPFCGNAENIEMCIDKEKFKLSCEKSGVPVVPWINVSKNDYEEKIRSIKAPVVIKPADYSGSKGVFKCYETERIREYVEKAMKFSKAGKVLIEKIMNVDNEFSVYYMMNHGQIYLTAMGDRYVNIIDPEIAPVGRGMIYPSVYLDEWEEKMDKCVRKFLKDNEMNNGFAFFQGFYENGNFYIHEIGYRLNGGFTYDIIQHFSGYHQMHQLLKFSLTGQMDDRALGCSNPHFKGFGMIATISLEPGKISFIDGVEEIKNTQGVLKFHMLHDIGDELRSHGTTAQVFAYILCGVENKEGLIRILNTIKAKLIVRDENGKNMLRETINPEMIKLKE